MYDGRHREPVTLSQRILIVPQAHTAIFATRFQIEMYALFHRSVGARVGHLIGTPMILLGIFLALHWATQSIWGGVAALVVIVALGLRVDVLAAAIIGLVGGALIELAAVLAAAAPASTTVLFIVLVGVGCVIQTSSHLFEDVPPPLSGAHRFVPVREWIRHSDSRSLLRSTLLTIGVFFWLELWATPRIWAIQVQQLLMVAGYKPELRAALDRRAQEILADPADDWRRP